MQGIRVAEHMSLASNFAATLMKLLYDIQVADENDAYIAKVERFMVGFNEALVPGNFLVEFFPVLRHLPAWLPGAGFQRRFASWRAASRDLKNAPVAHVQEAMVSSTSTSGEETCR